MNLQNRDQLPLCYDPTRFRGSAVFNSVLVAAHSSGDCSSKTAMVGMPGFEPGTSASRRRKAQDFGGRQQRVAARSEPIHGRQ